MNTTEVYFHAPLIIGLVTVKRAVLFELKVLSIKPADINCVSSVS